MEVNEVVPTDRPETRVLSAWLWFLVGLGSGLVGLLPWLRTGLRLPVQNLWATSAGPEQMPHALLPFSQYAITLIIGVIVVGAVLAGLCARAGRSRRSWLGGLAVVLGVLVVQLGALLQTTTAVRAGLRPGRESTLYLAVLVAVTTLSILVGAVALGLVVLGPRGAAVVGLSMGAVALAPWLSGLLISFDTLTPAPLTVQLLRVLRWAPAVLVGVAIAWGGLRTGGRVVAAGLGLLLLWVVPALTTAISSSAGTRVLAHRPAEMARFAGQVFTAALTTPALALPPIVVAVVVAAVGLLGPRVLRRS